MLPSHFFDRYLALRQEMWVVFERLVQHGAAFPQLADVMYPLHQHPEGLARTTEGRSWFYATRLVADPAYRLLVGEDLIVGVNPVTFVDTQHIKHRLVPDITDLYWLSQLLDSASS